MSEYAERESLKTGPKVKDASTAERIDGTLSQLSKAVDRLQETLDYLEQVGSKDTVGEEKAISSVVGVWRRTPGYIARETERIHEQINRLKELFA